MKLMRNGFIRRLVCLCLAALMLCAWAAAEPASPEIEKTPRDEMIDDILNAAHDQYVQFILTESHQIECGKVN